MNKLTTIVIGLALFVFASFTGASAFAAPPQTCLSVGLSNIPKGDPRYIPSLDVDGDGVMCEGNGASTGSGSGTQPNNVPAQTEIRDSKGNVIPSTGQVDANGNPVKLDSNGNPIQLDEHGNPISADRLAKTGPDGVLIFAGLGLLALAAGAFIVYSKRKA